MRANGQEGALRQLLQECYATITELKEKNRLAEQLLRQKDCIIDQLVREKQEHILHLATCEGDALKRELAALQKRIEEMRVGFEAALQGYEQVVGRQEREMQKLRGFNKVLRAENGHLRERGRQGERQVGRIVQRAEDEGGFAFTVNGEGTAANQMEFTPQKFKTSKSVSLTTASHSKPQPQGRALFNNSLLRQQLPPSPSPSPSSPAFPDKLVSLWFSKLRVLLADSDEQ